MKFLIIFTVLVLTVVGHYPIEASSVFQKTFRILHQEPPPPSPVSRALVQSLEIEQKVDNFDPKNSATWMMRYKSNGEHHKLGGPIFIFVGGEWEISNGYITGGHFFDLARENNGYLFYTEHRYYGKSFPTKDISTPNLKYLSVGQALADLANFIKKQKEKPEFKNSKVILAGGSYSATMVTWFRQKYPELAVGAWASSAPLFAKVDFKEYKEVTGRSIKLVGGDKCYNRIQNGIKELEQMIDMKKVDEVKKMLKICDNFNSEDKLDVWSLFGAISDLGAGLVQGHNKGDIENDCKMILEEKTDLDGLSKWLLSKLGSGCNDFTYKASVKDLSNTEITNFIYRQWIYQTCSEFGWYQTSTSAQQPFGTKFPVQLYEQMCKDVYGISKEKLAENIQATNKLYGGWEPKVSNVYMTHGHLDPWNAMGVHKNEDGSENVIPLYAHCKDFTSISDKDTAEMKVSKEKLRSLVKKWLM